jgi:2Fe-2S ferredoxin
VAGTVRVEPAGLDIDVADAESVMHAAERQGYRWPTVCHGQAVCTTCAFEVVDGAEHLAPPQPLERAALAQSPVAQASPGARLACQARVTGPVTVHKRGVRPAGRPADAPPADRHPADRRPADGHPRARWEQHPDGRTGGGEVP